MNTRDTIRQYISAELLDNEVPVTDDENLLSDGMVDSLGMLQLVAHIEEAYGVKVPPEDFTITNFRTIATVDAYLTKALNSSDESDDAG